MPDLTLHDTSLSELVGLLKAFLNTIQTSNGNSADAKVRIVLSNGQKWCVGKVLAMTDEKDMTVMLFPAPENIENLNAISKLMTTLTCNKAAGGQECGSCPQLATCPQMEAVDESFKRIGKEVRHGKGRKGS